MLRDSDLKGKNRITGTTLSALSHVDAEAMRATATLLTLYTGTRERIYSTLERYGVADISFPTPQEASSPAYQRAEQQLEESIAAGDPLALMIGFGELYKGALLAKGVTIARLEEIQAGTRSIGEMTELATTLHALAEIHAEVTSTFDSPSMADVRESLAPYMPQTSVKEPAQTQEQPSSIWEAIYDGFVALAEKGLQETSASTRRSAPVEESPTPAPISPANRFTLGNQLRQYRLRHPAPQGGTGLTQGEIAKRLKLSNSYISGVERGEIRPSKETLENVMEALDVPEAEREVLRMYRRAIRPNQPSKS